MVLETAVEMASVGSTYGRDSIGWRVGLCCLAVRVCLLVLVEAFEVKHFCCCDSEARGSYSVLKT